MSFRRRRDQWEDFLQSHLDELIACGLPYEILRPRLRFLAFLEHGFDDGARRRDGPAAFSVDCLTDDQFDRFVRFVETHLADAVRPSDVLGWRQARAARD